MTYDNIGAEDGILDSDGLDLGGIPQVGDGYDALVAANDPSSPDTTDYTYYNGGRRGTRGRSTHSGPAGAINEFYLDYDGTDDSSIEDTPGVCMLAAGIHILEDELSPRRGGHVVGPRLMHSRGFKGGPNDPSGGTDEIICALWTRDLTDSQVAVRCDPAVITGDPKGASFGYLSIIGDNREQDLVLIKNSDTHVFQDVKFAETNGTALVNSGGFATTTVECVWQDCGQYDAGAGINNAAVHTFSDPDSGRSANFKIFGGKLLGETADAGTQIRAPQGGTYYGGRNELSVKMENSEAIPAIEGQSMWIRECVVTGLNQDGPIGIQINGGTPKLQDVRCEKIGTGIRINGFSDKESETWTDIAAVGNADNGIEMHGSGQLTPQIHGLLVGGNGGDGLWIDSDVSNFADMQVQNAHFYNNTGYVLNDTRTGSQETSLMVFRDVKTDDIGAGVFTNPQYISHFSGDLDNDVFLDVTIPSGNTSATVAHGLYSEWDPVVGYQLQPTTTNGIGAVTDVTFQDNDGDGYDEDVQVTVGSSPSADTTISIKVLGETAIGGDTA